MRWETGTDILKGVFKRLVFGLSESSKSKHVVKGEATVDVLGMCIYASPLPMLDVKVQYIGFKGVL